MRIGGIKQSISILDEFLSTSKPWTARKINSIHNKNPQRFEEIAECGMFNLIKKGRLSEDIFTNIDDNIYFTENFLKDIKKVDQGKPLVAEIPKGTSLDNIKYFVEEGEVGILNGKLYANQKGKAIELHLSKEKFEELFPLIDRFKISQGEVGDCWLISGIDNFISNPTERVELYKLMRQDGNDILIKYPSGRNELRFINGEPFNDKGLLCSGTKGHKILEQSFIFHRKNLYTRNSSETNVLARLEENPNLISKLESGLQAEFTDAVYGRDSNTWANWKAFFKTIYKDIKYRFTTSKSQRSTPEELRRWTAKNKPYLITYSCKTSNDYKFYDGLVNPEYNLYSPHAYSLKDYNSKKNTATLSNPHHTEVLIEAPINVLEDYGHFVHLGSKV